MSMEGCSSRELRELYQFVNALREWLGLAPIAFHVRSKGKRRA